MHQCVCVCVCGSRGMMRKPVSWGIVSSPRSRLLKPEEGDSCVVLPETRVRAGPSPLREPSFTPVRPVLGNSKASVISQHLRKLSFD